MIGTAWVVGSFVLALLAAGREDPTTPRGALFLLAALSGVGWLLTTYGQELLDSVQTMHSHVLQAVGHSLSQRISVADPGLGHQYLAMARGFGDAASAKEVDHGALMRALAIRALVVVVPPVAGWVIGLGG